MLVRSASDVGAGAARRSCRLRRRACRVHVGLVARADLGRDRVDRMRRGHDTACGNPGRPRRGWRPARARAPCRSARRSANRPTRRRARCTQTLPRWSHFMPSGRPGSSSERMPLANTRPLHSEPSAFDVEHADQRLHGVVDVEQLFVRREAQPVRLVEQMAVDHELRLAAAGRHAIDALEAELARPLDAIDRHAAVPGIGEIDRAVGVHAHVVRAVELLALEMRGQHLAPPVGPLADEARVACSQTIRFRSAS